MDATDPKSAHLLMQVEGGGWEPIAWSYDNKQLIVVQYISINETYLWLVDAVTGEKSLLTPKVAAGQDTVAYSAAAFSKDGRSLYAVCDLGGEFQRLARFDLATMKPTFLTASIPWDVEAMSESEDGKSIGFATNENGISKLYLLTQRRTSSSHCRVRPSASLPLWHFTPTAVIWASHSLLRERRSMSSPSMSEAGILRAGRRVKSAA